MALVVPVDLLTEIELPKVKSMSYKSLNLPFNHLLIEEKNTDKFLNFLNESTDGRARSFTVQVVTEVFKLARKASTTADLCGILAVVTSLYPVNPEYAQRLLGYYRSLSSRTVIK